MSQVRFKTEISGTPCEVMAGWDRPLKGYFLSVFDLTDSDDPDYVGVGYEKSMHDPDADMGFAPSTDYFRAILKDKGIEPPEGFWERVELREANVLHNYKNGVWESC